MSHLSTKAAKELLDGIKDKGMRQAMEQGLGLAPVAPPPAPAAGKVSIRVPKARKTPQTEIEYEQILRREFPDCRVIHEGVMFRLPSGSRYTADFTVWSAERLVLIVECKGSRRLGSAARSYEAFKTMIATYPFIVHRFAEKGTDGQWILRNYNTQP